MQDKTPLSRRHIQRMLGLNWRKEAVSQHPFELAGTIRMAKADWRAFDSGPYSASVWRNDQHPAIAGKNSPGFTHHRAQLFAVLRGVYYQ